jgi:ATP-dependent DNA helicase DinG
MSLAETTKAEIRAALAAMREALPGFRERASQRKMIAEIAKTLSGEYGESRIIACEAGTGTGKSLAYLLSVLPVAKALRKQVVISTATIALQEQLLGHDLPTLAAHSGLQFSFALAKGRRRYACNLNLSRLAGEAAEQQNLFGEPVAAWTRMPQPAELGTVKRMRAAQQREHWNGDLDAWDEPLAGDFVEMITTDRHGCLGNVCPHIRQCAFFRARDNLREATLIVANHDLVLADLAMGSGVILPAAEETLFVFDEGHHLAAKAVRHFSAHTRVRGARDWLKRIPKLMADLLAILPDDPRQRRRAEEAGELAGKCMSLLEQAHEDLQTLYPATEQARWRFPRGEAPVAVRELALRLAAPAKTLADTLSLLRKQLIKAVDDGHVPTARCEQMLPDLGFLAARLENFLALWQMMGSEDPPEAPPTARWVELTGQLGRADMDFQLAASMIAPGALLRRALWDRCAGAVITSATLTALRRFERLRMNTGLREDDGTQYLRLDSPFDYAGRAELYLPWMDSDPRDPQAHTQEVTALLAQLIDPREGTLVLFASGWQLSAVHAALPAELRAQTLCQGELPKATILQRHRERIEGGAGSTIFGLASFTEGVDLPGELCRHVIIAKIPFAVPDSPVDATLADWLESQGRNPFIEISVPDASLKLIQACGRLIRSESDSGRVTVLDRRLVTKSYGRQLLDALPPFRRRIEQQPRRKTG